MKVRWSALTHLEQSHSEWACWASCPRAAHQRSAQDTSFVLVLHGHSSYRLRWVMSCTYVGWEREVMKGRYSFKYVQACIHTQTQTHTHTHTKTQKHTYMHIYLCAYITWACLRLKMLHSSLRHKATTETARKTAHCYLQLYNVVRLASIFSVVGVSGRS